MTIKQLNLSGRKAQTDGPRQSERGSRQTRRHTCPSTRRMGRLPRIQCHSQERTRGTYRVEFQTSRVE